MSLVQENQMPSPASRKSDDEKEPTTGSEVDTKPEEAKGGLSHYFVSVFDFGNASNCNLMV
jgi:hypothetical protein